MYDGRKFQDIIKMRSIIENGMSKIGILSGAAARTGGVNGKKKNNIYKITGRYVNKKTANSILGLNERDAYIW